MAKPITLSHRVRPGGWESMISANGGLPAPRYTPQVTQRWPRGSEPASPCLKTTPIVPSLFGSAISQQDKFFVPSRTMSVPSETGIAPLCPPEEGPLPTLASKEYCISDLANGPIALAGNALLLAAENVALNYMLQSQTHFFHSLRRSQRYQRVHHNFHWHQPLH